jgi:hypothetical protein
MSVIAADTTARRRRIRARRAFLDAGDAAGGSRALLLGDGLLQPASLRLLGGMPTLPEVPIEPRRHPDVQRAGSAVVEEKGSHAIYVSQPNAVAALIAKAAEGVNGAAA